MDGVLVVMEGTDGSGKTTQARRLHAYLLAKGRRPLHIREPGSTTVGERVRELLIAPAVPGETEILPETEVLLYMAARAQLFRAVIAPALKEGRFVILERSYFSTYAYQGAGSGVDKEMILMLGDWACGGRRPARVVLIDLPPAEALGRLSQERDRIEGRDLAYHERVRDGFLELSRRFPGPFRVVSGMGSEEEVEERIHAAVRDLL